MYNKIKRIGYLLSAIIILFFNIFVKCVPAFAAELALEQSYVVVSNWLNAAASNPHSNTFLTKVLGAVGAAAGLSALFGGDNPKEVTKDFINEYQNMQNANLNALVIEPAKFAKYLLWDKPQQYLPSDAEVSYAIKSAMDKTGASLVVFADGASEWGENAIEHIQELGNDTYMFYSSELSNAMNKYLTDHSKSGVYYENIDNIPVYEWDGSIPNTAYKPNIYAYATGATQVNDKEQYNPIGNVSNLYYRLNPYHNATYWRPCIQVIEYDGYYQYSFKYKNKYDEQYARFIVDKYDETGRLYVTAGADNFYSDMHYDKSKISFYWDLIKLSCDIPIFNSSEAVENYFNNGIVSGAINKPTIPENADIVLPKTSPDLTADHPYTLGDFEAIAEGYADVIDKVLEGVGEGAIDWPLTDGIAIDDDGAVSIPNVGIGENVDTVDLPVTIPYPSVIPWDDVIPLPYADNPAIDDPITDDPAIDEPIEQDIDIDIDDDNGDPLLDLSQFFPFCLPYDFMSAIKLLSTDGEPPVFEIPLKYNVLGEQVQHTVVIDIMKPGTTKDNSNAVAFVKYLKWFQTVAFITALIFITIKITPH